MLKNRTLTYVILLILCVSFSGCAALQKKFTRRKKKEKKIAPIVTTFDYSKELRVDELYKKHFLFWKSWQTELIDRMDATYKKRGACYDHTIASLLEMKKYLASPKDKELEDFIVRIQTTDPGIRKRRLTKSEKYRMRQLYEKTKRQIDKNFSYSQVKDHLELNKE